MLYERTVHERRFRRQVARIRVRFVALWARDPEQALEDLLVNLNELMRDAVRLDAACRVAGTNQQLVMALARHDPKRVARRF